MITTAPAASRTGRPVRGPARAPGPAPAPRPSPVHHPTTLRTNIAALAGAAALVGGSTALSPLIDGYAWLLPCVELIGVVFLVGAGARAARVPGWAVALLQVAGFAMAFTSLHLHTGIGGVLPGSAAFAEASRLLTVGWGQIMTTVPPAPVTPEMSMIISLLLGILALVIDALITGCHSPAMAALPLLGLYSVPAAIADSMLPWYAFVLPALGYVAVLAASTAGKGPIGGRAAPAAALAGLLIAAVSVSGAVIGAQAASSVGTEGRIPIPGEHTGQIGLSPWALLHGQLTAGDATDMVTVSGIDEPSYLRAFALEQWTANEGFGPGPLTATQHDIDGPLPNEPGFAQADIDASGVTTATITPSHYRDKYLPIYLDTVAIAQVDSGWDYDADLRTIFRSGKTTPGPYQVTVPKARATESELRTQPLVRSEGLLDIRGVPDSVIALSKRIVRDSGATTDFDAADALLRYFTDPANGFRYSLDVPVGNTGDALTDFLTQKTGYCEQYAVALAVMLRSVGIPARVGIGFTQGDRRADGSYLITSTNAHAWVEVPFRDAGWIIFDPTPAVDGQGGLQGFAAPGAPGPGASESPSATTTATTQTSPTTSLSLDGARPTNGLSLPDEDVGAVPQAAAQPGFLARFGWPLLIIIAAIGLLTIALLAPTSVRRWRRRRRLAAIQAGRNAAATAWLEITETMRDHGLRVDPAESARSTANTVALATRLSTQERTDLKQIVTAAEATWYGDAAAESPAAGVDERYREIARGVRGVVGALARAKPLRGAQRWWPASLARPTRL